MMAPGGSRPPTAVYSGLFAELTSNELKPTPSRGPEGLEAVDGVRPPAEGAAAARRRRRRGDVGPLQSTTGPGEGRPTEPSSALLFSKRQFSIASRVRIFSWSRRRSPRRPNQSKRQCKHFYSFLGPYINSCDAALVDLGRADRREPPSDVRGGRRRRGRRAALADRPFNYP